jgi:glucokinase
MADVGTSRVLTFDVGGSHVSAAVCYAEKYELGPVASSLYADVETSNAFVDLLCALAAEAANGSQSGMGATLAVPGPFDFQAGISLMKHKLPYLYGVDLRHALSGRLGCEPGEVRFLNDADAYLLGEVGAGAARDFSRAVGLTLGTGIGSAFTVDGRLVTEGPGVPADGEIWNVPYENGIVEDFVSARAVSGNYERRTGKKCTVAELAAVAPSDPDAEAAVEEFGQHLGRVVGVLLADFAADVVVLGGGISRSAHLFLPVTQSQIGDRTLRLRVSELKDRAPLVGCGVASFHGDNGTAAAAVAATALGTA